MTSGKPGRTINMSTYNVFTMIPLNPLNKPFKLLFLNRYFHPDQSGHQSTVDRINLEKDNFA
jgi:hypothetical protein